MIVGIRADLVDKFDLVCDKLCEELNDLLTHYVYEIKKPEEYYRTYEMDDNHIVKYKKIGLLNAKFYFDDKLITEIDNPYHHILEEGGTMEELVDLATWGRLEDMKDFIVKRFPQLYRKAMKGNL
jgi:hypothetical protein